MGAIPNVATYDLIVHPRVRKWFGGHTIWQKYFNVMDVKPLHKIAEKFPGINKLVTSD